MRKLLISLIVLGGLLVGADFGLRAYSESVVSKELQHGLDLSDRPGVSISGFPFVVHLASGDFPEATVQADSIRAHGVPFENVKVTLHDVTFPSSRLITQGKGTVHAKRGSGTAALTATAMTAALRSQGVPVTVKFEDSKVVLSDGVTSAEALPSVQGRGISLRGPAGAVALRLPVLLPGVTYTSLRVEENKAGLSLRFTNVAFPVSG